MKGYLALIIPLLLITTILISLNIFFQHSLQTEIAEEFNVQQLILTETVSSSLEEYLMDIKEEAAFISHIASKMKIRGKGDFEWLKSKSPIIKPDIKTNLGIISINGEVFFYDGDMDSFRNTAHHLLSKIKSNPSSNPVLVETAETIYFLSAIDGSDRAIVLAVSSPDMAKHFLNRLQAMRKGNAWILTEKGTLLYHPTHPEMAGRNIYAADNKCLQCHKSFDYEKIAVEDMKNLKGRVIGPSGIDKVMAFSKVGVDEISWRIFLSANYSDIVHITERSMGIYSYLILSILLATIFVSGALFLSNKKRILAKELEIRQESMQKYAAELEETVNLKTAALIREREKLTTILNAVGGGLILINQKGKILWANDKIKEMFSMEVAGKYCEELWHDCDISSSYAKDSIETTIMSINNEKRFLQMITAPVRNESGQIYRYIKLIQDVTEIKKLEDQIINSEKLASIGRLAAGIAHEIGNPLTSVFSFVQILRDMEDDKFKQESLETIYFHIRRISEVLKQLSGFSKMPTGELKLCQINEIIEYSTKLIQYDKKAKNIAIKSELSDSLPETIVDYNQLSQVFVNLILNAIDAMPDGGTLTIRSYVEADNIVVEFEDTGVGIPKDCLNIIFDPFFTTKVKGTGLGLAVSYNIIKKMKGTLTVESEPGRGSLFKITLPLTDGGKKI
jgi:PAS domain S-box-containing protein